MEIFDTLHKVLAGLMFLITSDFSIFQATFPHTYLLLFFVIRVIPVMILLWVPLRFFLKKINWNTDSINNILLLIYQSPLPLLIIILAAAGLRIWYCTTPLSFSEGDAACRMEIARDWLNNAQGWPGALIWPPVHFFILMIPHYLGFGVVNGARFITVLLGILTIPVLYLLVKERFNRSIALLACLILALNPFHIRYSIISMTEVPFLFFVLAGMLFLFRFIKTDKFFYLLFASFFLNCASMIRFEGWIVSALLPLFILYYKKGWTNFLVFAAFNAISVLVYMFASLKTTGHLVFGLYISDLEVRHNYELVQNRMAHILNGLSYDKVQPWWMSVLAISGIWIAVKRRIELPWLLLAVLLLALISWKVITGTNEPSWRYFSAGLFLLLPFTALGILKLLPTNLCLRTGIISAIVIFFLIKADLQYQQLKEQPFIPQGLVSAAEWIRLHKQPGDKYLFNSAGTEFAPMRVYTNAVMSDMYFPHYQGMKKFDNYESFNDTVFLRIARTPGYKYMVYQRGLEMDSVFHSAKVQEELRTSGPRFDSVYSAGNFRIYTIRQ